LAGKILEIVLPPGGVDIGVSEINNYCASLWKRTRVKPSIIDGFYEWVWITAAILEMCDGANQTVKSHSRIPNGDTRRALLSRSIYKIATANCLLALSLRQTYLPPGSASKPLDMSRCLRYH
jgi:hypothetical protein